MSIITKAWFTNKRWKQFTPKNSCLSTLNSKDKLATTAAPVSYCFSLIILTDIAGPGPGHYRVHSDFETIKYIKEMDDKGTYLTIDNGHLN